MWPDQVSHRGPLALESDVLLTVLRGPDEALQTVYNQIR